MRWWWMHVDCQKKEVSVSQGDQCLLEGLRACWQGQFWWQILLLLHASPVSPKECVISTRPTDCSYFCKASCTQGCCLLYLQSSLLTRAAPFDPALSIIVPTFRKPIVKGNTFVFFLCVCISLAANRDLADCGLRATGSKQFFFSK